MGAPLFAPLLPDPTIPCLSHTRFAHTWGHRRGNNGLDPAPTMWSHGVMSNDDEIERLLREVEGVTGGGTAQPPATRPESAPAKASGGPGQGMVLAISAAIGVLGLVLGFLPLVPNVWLGLGGFLGAWLGLTVYRRFS